MLVLSWNSLGLHVTETAWFPHAATSLCTTKEEQAEIMKYRNLWKRGSFRKRACLTEIPRIMEKWQKGKHGKGIVKQPVTERIFLSQSCFHWQSPKELKSSNVQNVSPFIHGMINTTEILIDVVIPACLSSCIYLSPCSHKLFCWFFIL